MIIVGLCGSSGSGKGTVCGMLEKRGIQCLDTDVLYHGMISSDSPCTRELISAFGEKIRAKNGGIDRRGLADLVFDPAYPERLNMLNTITHSHILREIEKWTEQQQKQGSTTVCIDAPMLFESGLDRRCDFRVCIIASENVKINRIMKRDGITAAQAKRRLSGQLSDEELRLHCDYVIENESGETELAAQVNKLIHDINFYGR